GFIEAEHPERIGALLAPESKDAGAKGAVLRDDLRESEPALDAKEGVKLAEASRAYRRRGGLRVVSNSRRSLRVGWFRLGPLRMGCFRPGFVRCLRPASVRRVSLGLRLLLHGALERLHVSDDRRQDLLGVVA